MTALAAPSAKLEDALLEWPLSAANQAYGKIDGRHLDQYVEEQAAMSRRYRDQGHPKFWGRIIGSSADAENAEWLAAKFKSAGLSDVRIQPLDLPPQWFPQRWDVTVTGGGKTIPLESAQPDYRAVALPASGIDVEAVYGGLGSAADLAGKDVQGKAVFTYTMLGMHAEDAVKRADEKGASVIFEVDMTPGNMRYQAYPSNTKAPAFTVGSDDGFAVRDLIASLPPGQSARVKATLDVEMVPNLKTALVWGAARCDGRNDLRRRASRRLVRGLGGQRERRGLDDRSRRVLLENSAGAAPSNDRVHRPRRASQHRAGIRRGRRVAQRSGEQGKAVRQDSPVDQLRAPLDDSDLRASSLSRRRCRALVEHVHRAAVVRGRDLAAGIDRDCRQGVQGVRRSATHRTESTSARG
jgi:hypothetical protein